MKIAFVAITGLLLALSQAGAQSTTKTTTTTTNPDGSTTTRETVTTSSGTLETFEPGTRFVVKETAGPVTYSYGPKVIYATRGGVILTEDQIRARIRVGVPVHVEYRPHGETRVIERVVIDD